MNVKPQPSLEEFDLIQIVNVDVNGILRGKVVPRHIAQKIVKNKGYELYQIIHCVGPAVDMAVSVPEIADNPYDNWYFWPVMETLVELPWASKPGRRVGQIIGHIVNEKGHAEVTTNRYQADRQLERLKQLGYSLTSTFTTQFTLFKKGSDFQEFFGGDTTKSGPYGSLASEEMMLTLCQQLQQAGVDVDSWTGKQSPGMFELSLAPAEGLRSGDMLVRLKHGTKAVMAGQGYFATFASSSSTTDLPPTLTFRFTLNNAAGENAFFDETKDDKISDVARHWIAGMIQHGRGATALFCPTFNCYRRFDVDKSAPTQLNWDLDTSSTYVNLLVQGRQVWIENRLPSAAANPYLVFTATLASGLDGLENQLICPQKSDSHAPPVPETLSQALKELQADSILEEALSNLLMKVFVALKHDWEVTRFKELAASTDSDKEQKLKELERHLYLLRL